MNKCQCDKPGHCDFYNKEMGSQPDNWGWCQGATPEQRERHKVDSIRKEKRETRIKGGGRYITIASMVEDCKKLLIPKLAKMNIKGVSGLPRSGTLPAAVCAMFLNVPLYNLSDGGCLTKAGGASDDGGRRMKYYKEKEEGTIVIIDDTLFSGEAMEFAFPALIREDVISAVLYVNPSKVESVDVYGMTLPHPYFLEWCFFNSKYIKNTYIDFDGILSPNVPYKIAIDDDKYIEYITNVEPYYDRLPTLFECKGIVTARLERYRDVTEAWLKKYNVNYGELIMFPTEREAERNASHIKESGRFKADTFIGSDAKIFVESESKEANIIRELSRKIVICPEEEKWA
jgi:uncharacterized HAD superfamily protein